MESFDLKYYIIYSIFALAAFIFAMYVDIKKKQYNNISGFLALILFIIIAVLFGFRNDDIGSDTDIYKWQFYNYSIIDFGLQIVFKYLIAIVSFFTNNHHYFLFLISLLYVLIIFWSIYIFSRIFETNFLLVAFAFVSLFFFKALGINIIRQGVALSLVLLAVSYYLTDKKNIKKWLLPFILAIGFHSTTIIVLIFFLIVLFAKKITLNYYYFWYFILLIISALGGGILSLGSFLSYFLVIDSKRADFYIKGVGGEEYAVGFKPQFVVFNTLFLIIFSFINFKIFKNENENYQWLLKYYLLVSGIFFMMFQIPYSDRWGVMSWIIIPFLLSPLFSIKNSLKYGMLTTVFLIFTFVFFSIYNS